MGKKNKSKKNKHKKNKSPSPNGDNNLNINDSSKSNEQEENNHKKKRLSKEIFHKKKKEIRKKLKRIHKKYKKKAGGNKFDFDNQYLEEIEDFLINPEDLEKLPHDRFTPYNIPISIEENKEYIPLLISESDIILELLDARDIFHSKNQKIEELVKINDKKLLIYVITKSDLVSEEYINKIKQNLDKENNNKIPIIITSSLMREKIQYFFDELKKQIELLQKKFKDKKLIKIGIIGAPNVGKNSLIQSLELIVNTNCDEKYIYFNPEKDFCINGVPGITYDDDEKNNFLISKKYKEIKDIPEPLILINNLMDIVDKNKIKDIYELNKTPDNLEDFINLLKEKYEFEDNNNTICKILYDIIIGKISYEVNN